MSGLVVYLEMILTPLPGFVHLALLLGDAIFNDSTVICNCTKVELDRLQLSLKSLRQGIELMYGLYFNWFALMRKKQAFKMLRRGEHAYRLAIVSFFMYNCFICLLYR